MGKVCYFCFLFFPFFSFLNVYLLFFIIFKALFLNTVFADLDENGNVTFSEEQRRRIINLDETYYLLDGCDGGRGGDLQHLSQL